MAAVRFALWWLKVIFVAVLSSVLAFHAASAHEVQPAVLDLAIDGDTAAIRLDWTIEAAVAEIDLQGLADTNNAANAERYDAARGLEPADLEAAFREAWPRLRSKITFRAGETAVELRIAEISIPPVGDPALARISRVTFAADLPSDGSLVVVGWTGDLGPLVVRQINVEAGYSAFLMNGTLTDPIPRASGTSQTASEAFVDYVGVGFDHIVPKGLDHILFVLGLFFLSIRLGALLWQVTAFTLAHTVTLALGALDIIIVSPDIVEPIIAASIVYVGIENLFSRGMTPWRPFVVFGFGLLHGLGFASVLQDFGLGAEHFVPKLIGFNVGVEIGQLAVIAAAFIALGALFGRYAWYKTRVSAPVSMAIALIATFWVLERTGVVGTDGALAVFSMLTEGGLPALTTTLAGIGAAVVLTGAILTTGSDSLRDAGGFLTSFAFFLAIVATFTSAAWILAAVLTSAWIVALRAQSLGEPEGRI